MNIVYLLHHQIFKAEWDELIDSSPQRQVYAMSWYLDVVAPGWEAVVELDLQRNYKTVMPIPWHRKLGMRYIQQPLYCQQLGVYSTQASIDPALYTALIGEIYKRFRYVINLAFNGANLLAAKLPLAGVQVHYTATHYLDLSVGYKHLFQMYTYDRKMNLKRAHRSQLSIIESDDLAPLIAFFKEFAAGKIYGGVSEGAYAQLRQLHQVLQQKKVAKLLYTVDETGRLNGGGLFVVWSGRIVYLFNAAPAFGRKQNGRTLLLDYMIQQYAGQEYTFDFESPDAGETSIVSFYESFGARAVPIPVLRYNCLPLGIRIMRELRMKLVRRLKGISNP